MPTGGWTPAPSPVAVALYLAVGLACVGGPLGGLHGTPRSPPAARLFAEPPPITVNATYYLDPPYCAGSQGVQTAEFIGLASGGDGNFTLTWRFPNTTMVGLVVNYPVPVGRSTSVNLTAQDAAGQDGYTQVTVPASATTPIGCGGGSGAGAATIPVALEGAIAAVGLVIAVEAVLLLRRPPPAGRVPPHAAQ